MSSNNNNKQNPFAAPTTGFSFPSGQSNRDSGTRRKKVKANRPMAFRDSNGGWERLKAKMEAERQLAQQRLAASQQHLAQVQSQYQTQMAQLAQVQQTLQQARQARFQANLAQMTAAAATATSTSGQGHVFGGAPVPRHGQDTFHPPTSAGTKYKSVTKPFDGKSNEDTVWERDAEWLPTKHLTKAELYGTGIIPYQATQLDDENLKLVSICAMEAYADKSPEELRMEDYLKHPDGFDGSKPESTLDEDSAAKMLPPSDPIDKDGESMDYELQKDDLENALEKANSFLQLLLAQLGRSNWSDLNSVVTLRHDKLLNHLVPLFLLREEWKGEGKRPQFSVGYHYTTPGSVQEIWRHGVLTKSDRSKAGVRENFSANVLGEGIYTGNHPTDFYNFRRDATIGIMVLRMFYDVGNYSTIKSRMHDTIVMRRSTAYVKNGEQVDYVNLRNSRQCSILMSFDGKTAPVDRLLELQTCVEESIDRAMADKEKLIMVMSPPKRSLLNKIFECHRELYRKNECREFTIEYSSPQTLCTSGSNRFFVQVPSTDLEPGQECPICLDTISGDGIFKIKGCKHVFHEDCMEMVNRKFSHCPVCRFFFKEPRGHMPDGRMKVSFDPKLVCAGNSPGTIKIEYTIFFGIQKSYHENRGAMFSGTSRPAYIPDTKEGRQLLRRLMCAFLHCLTFRVGTSLTSGLPDRVTWSIHHKTITGRGPHGYPDTSYFDNCNDDLNSYGVPSADSEALKIAELAEIDRYLEWRNHFTGP